MLLLIIIWWYFSGRKTQQPAVRAEERALPGEKTADDLMKIEGIGPKVASILKGAGITTFAALADADSTKVQDALNAAGLQMMNPDGWIEQAKLAAKGD